jgi:hypothetical protein
MGRYVFGQSVADFEWLAKLYEKEIGTEYSFHIF